MNVDALISPLWADVARDKTLRVFSLQDAAASPRIHPNMVLSMTDHACLYEGRIPQVLEEAAPHIVRLAAASSYTRWFLEEGWGRHWGVLLQSQANLMALRAHFRRLLLVQDQAGRKFNFRFFDPRVLRTYLPTCEPHELRAVFGPVARFFAEAENGSDLLVFGIKDGLLETKTLALAAVAASAPLMAAGLGGKAA